MITNLRNRFQGTLQEGGAPFQTTHWTVVLQAGKAEADESARKALAAFSEAYWPPLYTFVRRRGYSPADAQDIVQGFFEHLLRAKHVEPGRSGEGTTAHVPAGFIAKFPAEAARAHERDQTRRRRSRFVSFDDQLIEAEAAMQATCSFERRELLRCRVGFQHCDARVEERARPICCRRQTGMGR